MLMICSDRVTDFFFKYSLHPHASFLNNSRSIKVSSTTEEAQCYVQDILYNNNHVLPNKMFRTTNPIDYVLHLYLKINFSSVHLYFPSKYS